MPPETYMLLALGGLDVLAVALCLYLFMTLKVQLRSAERRTAAQLETLGTESGVAREAGEVLRGKLENLENSFQEVWDLSGTLVAPPPTRSGLNMSVRSQVLRRRRMGEDAVEIARSLGLPKTEVELLIKVNALLLSTLPPAR
jgi:hypothetical protein